MKMKILEEQYKKAIEDDFEQNRISANQVLRYIEGSTAKYKGDAIYSLYMPKLFPASVVEYLKENAEIMYGILTKVTDRYLTDAAYRKLFSFDSVLEDLILHCPRYENKIPIARLDIFLNEEDLSFKFCEFNTDGTSAMNEDRELNIAVKRAKVFRDFEQKYTLGSFELFDSWVQQFEQIYRTEPNHLETPHVAIVDFLEKGCSTEEFEEFRSAFERAGFSAEIAEIRNLKNTKEGLFSEKGNKIDVIYRRAVTSDILEHMSEVQDFLSAVKDEKVCLIGDFCTQIAHDKILFYILHQQDTHSFLTQQEIQYIDMHIPYTVKLDDDQIEKNEVIEHRERWLIKPRNSYGARGIFAGIHYSLEEWKKAVSDHKNNDYILQEFVLPYQSWNIDFHKDKPEFLKYSNLTGMYMYNGKMSGLYSRQSEHEIISNYYDENDIASVCVSER